VDVMAAMTELMFPDQTVLEKTIHLYQPGTRRPYGLLEWSALICSLEAASKRSAYPGYDTLGT
jgi:hypothetical protein